MTEEQVLRYLQLVDRHIFITMNSGVTWKPEYAKELEEINKEIAELRKVIDVELERRGYKL